MRQVAVPILAILIFLLFWEALVWVNDWPNYKMASPAICGLHFGVSNGCF